MSVKIELGILFILICLFLPACKRQAETKIKAPEFAYMQSEVAGEKLILLRPPITIWQSDTRLNIAIHNGTEWEAAWRQTSTLRNVLHSNYPRSEGGIMEPIGKFPPSGFDFEHYIILVAFQGAGNAARLTEIVSATDIGDAIKVEVIHNTCFPGDTIISAETNPADAVAIKKTNKRIVFNITETNKCPGLIFKPNMTRS